jgi:hypothetical protein
MPTFSRYEVWPQVVSTPTGQAGTMGIFSFSIASKKLWINA